MVLLELSKISKRYGATMALRECSLQLREGGLYLLTGANGAGKSTLLRLAAGLERPSSGSVLFGGKDLGMRRVYVEFLRDCRPGYLGSECSLYAQLSVRENLLLNASLRRIQAPERAVTEICERLQIARFLDRRIAECSQGMKRRAALARVFLGEPKMFFLDEPFITLDDEGVRICTDELVRCHRQGATVILATHTGEFSEYRDVEAIHLNSGRRTVDA